LEKHSVLIAGMCEGDPEAPKAFATAAHGYVRILTDHINKEKYFLCNGRASFVAV
jgi:hemerythrin-like domain-containing protein